MLSTFLLWRNVNPAQLWWIMQYVWSMSHTNYIIYHAYCYDHSCPVISDVLHLLLFIQVCQWWQHWSLQWEQRLILLCTNHTSADRVLTTHQLTMYWPDISWPVSLQLSYWTHAGWDIAVCWTKTQFSCGEFQSAQMLSTLTVFLHCSLPSIIYWSLSLQRSWWSRGLS